jgi:hypothetical protein
MSLCALAHPDAGNLGCLSLFIFYFWNEGFAEELNNELSLFKRINQNHGI